MAGRRQRLAALVARGARRTAAGLAAAREAFLFPAPVEGVPVHNAVSAPILEAGRPVKALVWNIQFSAGQKHAFFYDYGQAVSVPLGDVEDALAGIAEVIRRHDPDLVLLQEVDRGARRTGFVDEHARLLAATGLPCHASTPYWRAPYVPHPGHEHLGKVEMHLSVMSRFRLGAATRRTLPPKPESWLRHRLGIQRALFEVEVLVAGGRPLALIDVHLEAFSFADGTLGRQVAALDDRLADLEARGSPWIAAGDYNSLPPGDDRARLDEFERSLYPERTDLERLFDRWPEPVRAGWRADPSAWRTYLPFRATAPDRTLDYLFHGTRVRVLDHAVLRDAHSWSDHLPLLTTFEVTPG